MLISILLSLAVLTPPTPAQNTGWQAGELAPHVHLPDIRSGEAVDLAQFRGKKVLLAEFASW